MRAKVLRAELKYLNDIPEIQWWEVVQNKVFMSFSPVPNDYEIIIRDAALKGNKKIDFGVHGWAVKNGARSLAVFINLVPKLLVIRLPWNFTDR